MMVDRKALTEAMAQAIGQAIGGKGWWAVAKHDAREATRREASAAIEALEGAGYVILPRHLSDSAAEALSGDDISRETVRIIHDRMVAAIESR
ncbi:hypothetical protein [Fodinicurvata sp. EGI_FJ10296]|uniref:hypothetical protein n=1 Tax=Fodinicurvata sp. EGI_FJ10296 TaxID=3231908 RepID=UPI00345147B8